MQSETIVAGPLWLFLVLRLEATPNLFTIQSNGNDTKDNGFDERYSHVATSLVSS